MPANNIMSANNTISSKNTMSSINGISVETLFRLIGTPQCPSLIDVRTDEDYALAPTLLPGAMRRAYSNLEQWLPHYLGKPVIIICHKGKKLSEGVAALLRHRGLNAQILEGGFVAWQEAVMPLVRQDKLPERDHEGRTLWVTRERPKIDRLACPWLIRRFIDPSAAFLFVSPPEVSAVGEKFGAVPFDIEGVFWSHRGELCSFDVMIEEFGLATPALLHLATIVRAADTARLDLAPEAAGLLAASLGLSRMYSDDLAQLEAGLHLYDAFYIWCRDATKESHNWPVKQRGT